VLHPIGATQQTAILLYVQKINADMSRRWKWERLPPVGILRAPARAGQGGSLSRVLRTLRNGHFLNKSLAAHGYLDLRHDVEAACLCSLATDSGRSTCWRGVLVLPPPRSEHAAPASAPPSP